MYMASGNQSNKWGAFFAQWEFFLVVLFVAFNGVMALTTRNYLNVYNLFDMTLIFVEKAIVALIMTFIIITGNIDLSVASIMALSSVSMATLFASGANIWLAMLFGIGIGTLCGFLNGLITTKIELPSMIITLATFSLYRGVAYVILGDEAVTGFPASFTYLGTGYIGNTPVPFSFTVFLALAVIAGIILHKTRFGRMVYAMGWNEQACYASGIPVKKIKMVMFTVSGFLSSLAAMFLTARIGNTRPNLATGFELEIITIVILGGVAITGGIGKMWGVFLSIFLIGTIRYGLGLHNIPGQVMLIISGALLILSILLNNLVKQLVERRSLREAKE